MTARESVRRALGGRELSRDEARDVVAAISREEFEPSELAELFAAVASRGETTEELIGGTEALGAAMQAFVHPFPDVLDVGGTGAEGLHTFNLSLTSALVAAAAGARVVLQGERSMHACASDADVLGAAGLPLDLEPRASACVLEEVGITFLHAPRYHPALRASAAVRRTLGAATWLELCALLAHPAGPRRRVLGVGDARLAARLAALLELRGIERAYVVHGAGRAAQLTLAGENSVVALGDAPRARFDAPALALPPASVGALAGGDRRHNLSLLERLLAGENGALGHAVVLNAAAALVAAGIAPDPVAAAERARALLRGGSVRRLFGRWLEVSSRLGQAA